MEIVLAIAVMLAAVCVIFALILRDARKADREYKARHYDDESS